MYWLTIGSFVFFTGLVALGTWLLTRGRKMDTVEGYFLAGRSLTGGFIAGSLLLTNLSTEQLVGLNGAAFKDGLSVIAWEVIAAVSIVVMALFFLPRFLKSGVATVPQFLEARFDGATRAITSFVFIAAYVVIVLPMLLYTGARGLMEMLDTSRLTGLESEWANLWICVWIIGWLGSLYAIFGGLRTVAISDTLNGVGLLVGGLLITWFALAAVSDDGPWAALAALRAAHPGKFNSLGAAHQSVPFATLFTGVLLINLFYWCTNQQIIQRAFAATTLKEGQMGALIAACFKLLAPLILVLPGIIAFHLYAAEGVANDTAYGLLVRRVLPAPLTGFFAAVIVGAVLSSFNSVLNSSATLFSLGLYRDMLRPDAAPRETIRVGQAFSWIAALASMTAAPFLVGQDTIFGYLQKMNGLYFIPIFAVVVVGMTTRRVPALAANAALVVGLAVISLGYFAPPFSTWVAGLHEFHFLGMVFVGLVALMLVVGQCAPRAEPWTHRHSGDVDLTPWRWAYPVAIAVALAAAAIYVCFADVSALRPAPPAKAAAAAR